MSHPDSVDDAIKEIFSLSLAKRKDLDTIWVHPLVHSWSRERLDQGEKERKAFHAISLVATAVSVDRGTFRKLENWVKELVLLPHIQRCFYHICRDLSAGNINIGASQRDNIKPLAEMLSYHAEHAAAEELYQWVLPREEKSLGKDHPDTIFTVYCLANVFRRQGEYSKALEWYRRALAGEEKSLGKDHPDTLSTVHGMAMLLQNQGKCDEALEWYRRALSGEEKSLGKERSPLSMVWQQYSRIRESTTRRWCGTGGHSLGKRNP